MNSLLGVAQYEYKMSIRRWGFWVVFVLAAGMVLLDQFGINWMGGGSTLLTGGPSAQTSAGYALLMNYYVPIIGGIALADRLARDKSLNVGELLFTSNLSKRSYVFGKYLGSVTSVVSMVLVFLLIGDVALIARGWPLDLIPYTLLAFLAITVPAYLFVGAFAIACPAIMPVRIFQVLYTGYWVWGNFTSPDFIPSLSETILTPAGKYAGFGFFGATMGVNTEAYTTEAAIASVVVLIVVAMLPLFALTRYLNWQESQA
jgi:ABC-type Na+ efflux pump permease subunit